MEEPEMQLKGKKVTDKFTESVYVLANEPSVALYRLQEHVRRSLPELAQHKADMQRWEEQSQGAIYTVEYACRTTDWPVGWTAAERRATAQIQPIIFTFLFLSNFFFLVYNRRIKFATLTIFKYTAQW
uniref:Protein MEF2BNB n=1 Tax=Felis catus TaxID=9685 RepID=A0ABI7Z340_FELCA